jgi:hypothetical protein
LGGKVAAETIASMSICRQDSETEIPELAGATCERLLGVQSKLDNDRIVPCLFWLKIKGARWHRFFIDAWILQWREYDEIDTGDLTYDSEFPVLDIAVQHALVGCVIAKIQMTQTPEDTEFDSRLAISFAGGKTLTLQYAADDERLSIIDNEAAHQSAPPNGGPGASAGNSNATEGPSSVS